MPYALLVEDNKAHALLLWRALRKIPNAPSLQHVCDGQTALDLLKDRSAREDLPTLVLLDLRLPKLSGFDVLQRIRERPEFAAIPVVILSTSNRECDIELAKEYGATDFWSKPVSTEELTQHLKTLSVTED